MRQCIWYRGNVFQLVKAIKIVKIQNVAKNGKIIYYMKNYSINFVFFLAKGVWSMNTYVNSNELLCEIQAKLRLLRNWN